MYLRLILSMCLSGALLLLHESVAILPYTVFNHAYPFSREPPGSQQDDWCQCCSRCLPLEFLAVRTIVGQTLVHSWHRPKALEDNYLECLGWKQESLAHGATHFPTQMVGLFELASLLLSLPIPIPALLWHQLLSLLALRVLPLCIAQENSSFWH